jgi:ferredoxin
MHKRISFPTATLRLYELNDDLRMWYDDVEPDLHVYQLNARAVFRKNGFRITPQTYVSYVDGTNGNRVSIGIVVSITVGCRAAYPRVAGCAVCAIRVLHEARIEKLGESANVIVVNNVGPPSALELVCCTRLKNKYFKTLWDIDLDNRFALVKFDEY